MAETGAAQVEVPWGIWFDAEILNRNAGIYLRQKWIPAFAGNGKKGNLLNHLNGSEH